MTLQLQIIEETKKAAAEAFKYILAVPEDKADWKPLDQGRSVLSIAQELAKCPDWASEILTTGWNTDEAAMAQQQEEMGSWTTTAECEKQCMSKLEKYYAVLASISDSDLEKTQFLPFDGGRDFTYAEMMSYPRWNFNWHAGQVAYIQTLYGDNEMH
ncbi:hypothetical protein BH11ARM1_BH11ARM1_05120 [soil metagenome]